MQTVLSIIILLVSIVITVTVASMESEQAGLGTLDGSVIIDEIQAPGKKKMKTSDFLRGNNIEGRFENKR